MTLGFIGLGKMGQQMVTRLLQAGHEVIVTDLNPEFVNLAVAAGAKPAAHREELVAMLGESPVVWLMIPAGFVTAEVAALLSLMPQGGLIVDGGNSQYQHTQANAQSAAAAGVEFVDVGTSGGVLGLEKGFSMMVGGSEAAITRLTSALEALAQPHGWRHFGPAGSGHFIKMVHNGIEYGIMEAYAEGYQILHEGHDFGTFDLAAVAEVWQHGSIINSGLNELVGKIMTHDATLEGIPGVVAESGEARWTLEAARTHNIPAPAMQAALDVRVASQTGQVNYATKLLAAMRNAFGGHALTGAVPAGTLTAAAEHQVEPPETPAANEVL